MNFLILGCSWGVPNYFGPPGDPVETHTESRLRSSGHCVFNCAQNGGSNLQSIARAKSFFNGDSIEHPASKSFGLIKLENINVKIDWIVWFQTEFIRDRSAVSHSSKVIENLARITYSTYQNFVKSMNSKLALIGANSDVHPCYKDYLDPEFIIPSWTSEILNIEPVLFDCDDPNLELKFIDNELRLQKLKQSSYLFPDRSHPGGTAHAKLVKDLLACVTN